MDHRTPGASGIPRGMVGMQRRRALVFAGREALQCVVFMRRKASIRPARPGYVASSFLAFEPRGKPEPEQAPSRRRKLASARWRRRNVDNHALLDPYIDFIDTGEVVERVATKGQEAGFVIRGEASDLSLRKNHCARIGP